MRLFSLWLGLLLVLFCQNALAGQKSVTFYLDAARVEQEVATPGGYFELPLPDRYSPGSLRVKVPGAGTVTRVELVPAGEDRRRGAEIARLKERRAELLDRMAALEKREAIFSAAAKSQSGKAPRKTKNNPDPVGTLQQGTEFALNQMEVVYRSKRKCHHALDAVERQLAAAEKGVASARVWVAASKARVSYLVREERWIPSYDVRCSGEKSGELQLHAKLPQREKGVQYLVSLGTAAQGGAAEPVRGEFPVLGRYPLALAPGPVAEPVSRIVFAPVQAGLPPGEGSLYWKGEYLGSGRFAGGGATEFSVGDEQSALPLHD